MEALFLSVLLGMNLNSLVHGGLVRDLPRLNKAWQDSLRDSDWNTFINFYSADCVLLPPHSPSLWGHDQIAQWFQAQANAEQSGIDGIEYYIASATQFSFDSGLERGRYLYLDAQHRIVDEGKYVRSWRLQQSETDGSRTWKINTQIFNSNLPLEMTEKAKDVNADIMQKWSNSWLKCLRERNAVECRSIVEDDIVIVDKVKREEYEYDEYQSMLHKMSDEDINNAKVEKIAANKGKVSWENTELVAFFDLSSHRVWRIEIDSKAAAQDNHNKPEL